MVTQAWSTFTPFTEGGRLVSIISSMLLLLVGKFTVALYQFWQEALKRTRWSVGCTDARSLAEWSSRWL